LIVGSKDFLAADLDQLGSQWEPAAGLILPDNWMPKYKRSVTILREHPRTYATCAAGSWIRLDYWAILIYPGQDRKIGLNPQNKQQYR